ncbi:acetylornithine deacetylase [Devosia pacifica]|uniref:Acetylornithine deacetylase n=1 Tax=Devosia pacifica TaxID=1335967 RepID=A0A918RYS6_9HYPH|nr:acetylornithine deacetylase [Devosia pacifica]GHA16315.1 acetylornithine deacetylase [Devosia pacifica]
MAHHLLEETLSTLSDLIGFESVSSESNLELIAYVNHKLDQIGADTFLTLDPGGHKANLFATIGPADEDGGIVLSGHTDVVPVEGQDWSTNPFEAHLRDGRVFGRGTCDMKGFIACAMAFAPHFAAQKLSRPLHLAFTYDEEVGCLGAQVMLDELKASGRKPSVCIVGEPTSMRIVEGNKGCCEYSTHFKGAPGHASEPDRGVNAVEYAARYIGRLLEIGEELKTRAPENSRFDPPWSTIQVGRIAGGVARNIIASACSVDWELRPINAEDFQYARSNIRDYVETELLPKMRKVHPDADVITEVIGEVIGLEPMSDNEAEALVRELTGDRHPATCVPFGTEAGLFQQHGVATVLCGPGAIAQAHKADEYVSLEQLNSCLDMIGRLQLKLASEA